MHSCVEGQILERTHIFRLFLPGAHWVAQPALQPGWKGQLPFCQDKLAVAISSLQSGTGERLSYRPHCIALVLTTIIGTIFLPLSIK